MSTQEHAAGWLDLLNANAALTVLDGKVPQDVEPPYVLVYITVDDTDGASPEWGDGLDGLSGAITTRIYCHSVGETPQAARIVDGQVRTALLNKTPTVTGRSAGIIRRDFSSPPVRDETMQGLNMDAISVYRCRTVPS